MNLPPLRTRECFWNNDFFSLQFCSIDLGNRFTSMFHWQVSETCVLVTRQHESGDVYTLLLVLTLSLFITLDTGNPLQPTTLAKNLE